MLCVGDEAEHATEGRHKNEDRIVYNVRDEA